MESVNQFETSTLSASSFLSEFNAATADIINGGDGAAAAAAISDDAPINFEQLAFAEQGEHDLLLKIKQQQDDDVAASMAAASANEEERRNNLKRKNEMDLAAVKEKRRFLDEFDLDLSGMPTLTPIFEKLLLLARVCERERLVRSFTSLNEACYRYIFFLNYNKTDPRYVAVDPATFDYAKAPHCWNAAFHTDCYIALDLVEYRSTVPSYVMTRRFNDEEYSVTVDLAYCTEAVKKAWLKLQDIFLNAKSPVVKEGVIDLYDYQNVPTEMPENVSLRHYTKSNEPNKILVSCMNQSDKKCRTIVKASVYVDKGERKTGEAFSVPRLRFDGGQAIDAMIRKTITAILAGERITNATAVIGNAGGAGAGADIESTSDEMNPDASNAHLKYTVFQTQSTHKIFQFLVKGLQSREPIVMEPFQVTTADLKAEFYCLGGPIYLRVSRNAYGRMLRYVDVVYKCSAFVYYRD